MNFTEREFSKKISLEAELLEQLDLYAKTIENKYCDTRTAEDISEIVKEEIIEKFNYYRISEEKLKEGIQLFKTLNGLYSILEENKENLSR